ncbi:hypothetical protein H632_c2659p0, partial [Helicosporidium sp. ATCC 50920]
MAHGYLSQPQSRNMLAWSDFCPHCLNAGGPWSVGGGRTWPVGDHGMCGDPYSTAVPRPHESGGAHYTGTIAATWTEGNTVEIKTVITAFHMGRFGFRICKVNGNSAQAERTQLTDACLDQNILVQADVPGAQAPGDRYYHLGAEGQGTYTMQYQLPKGLSCDGVNTRCVLQWHYLTGNSCNPPNEPSQYVANKGLG